MDVWDEGGVDQVYLKYPQAEQNENLRLKSPTNCVVQIPVDGQCNRNSTLTVL